MANLSAVALLQFITDIVFLVIFIFAAADAVRHRTRASVDVALFFGDIALIIGITWIASLLGLTPGRLLTAFTSALLMALPYLLLRLVGDYSGLPPIVETVAGGGLVISIVGVFALPQPYPIELIVPLVLYFVLLEVYEALAFVGAARQSRGVTQRRMQAVAAGSLFLGLDILGAGLTAVVPHLAAVWTMFSQVTALIAGCAYAAGFAPPSWLRQSWQAPELRAALRQSAVLVRLPDLASLVHELELGCAASLGATQAAIGLWNDDRSGLRFRIDGQERVFAASDLDQGRPFNGHRSLFAANLTGMSAEFIDFCHVERTMAALLAPITADKRRFGKLVVFVTRAPLFAEDDLALAQVLADQMAVILENRVLVEEIAQERTRAEALAVAEAERRRVNLELETRVRERTGELQEALRELEAFSYSVSHDLRAPLRTIDGFVQAFLEDYGEQLDSIGRDYLQRTRAASQRMGQLIDGLLRLSRVTRSDMNREVVDLSGMARSVVADLQKSQPDRSVTCIIQDGLQVEGDGQLLYVVLENLLGNAWKFTGKRSDARIEFGLAEGDRSVYVVRDNGAGFDMAYVHKLFGPFQRLHGKDEFDGTGIGLATVHRIVRRHGGRIWAESAVDRGASFYFTLKPEPTRNEGESGGDAVEQSIDQPANLVGRR